jgi:hypothetical protein
MRDNGEGGRAPCTTAARPEIEPRVDRDLGWISFKPLHEPEEIAQAQSLCDFLCQHDIPSYLVERLAGFPVIELRGVPNFDTVDRLVRAWSDRTAELPSLPPRPWVSLSGCVQAVDQVAGTVTIATDDRSSVVAGMMADRRIAIGDELRWDEAPGLGAQVYRNVTRGTRMKVYAIARNRPTQQIH